MRVIPAAVRPYAAVFRSRCLLLLQYRAAAAAGVVTQCFWGIVRVMVLSGFYAAAPGAGGTFSLPEAITYVWLGQAFLLLIPWTTDGDLRAMIMSGDVAYELVRPVDLYGVWYFRAVAMRVAPTALRALPMLVIAWAFFGMRLPPTPAAGCAWLAAAGLAVLLAAAISALTTITIIWTLAGDGVARLLPSVAFFCAGMVIPIPLLPPWAQPILALLPFRGLMDAPFRLYMGHIAAADAWRVLLHQGLWTVGLVLFGRWLLGRGLRRLVVQGG
jgi:ABC-2 type transport system permease protein